MTSDIRFESPWFGEMFKVYDGHVMIGEVPFSTPGKGHGLPDTWMEMFPVGESAQERVIHSDQSLDFHYNWRAEGLLNGLDLSIAGTFPGLNQPAFWEIKTLVEGVGPGLEEVASTIYEPFVKGAVGPKFQHWYHKTLTVAPPSGVWPAGVYDIVVTIQLVGYDGTVVNERLPIAGFAEMGKIQIYHA